MNHDGLPDFMPPFFVQNFRYQFDKSSLTVFENRSQDFYFWKYFIVLCGHEKFHGLPHVRAGLTNYYMHIFACCVDFKDKRESKQFHAS